MDSPLMIFVDGEAGGNSSSELFGDVLLDGITWYMVEYSCESNLDVMVRRVAALMPVANAHLVCVSNRN